ncbi:YbfB/YjiJ family MFS transporter [Herbaspirillum sp. RV1423]|uniref:YbfB/YjiJ family MFS transporter n=1 Tax=Herbaspirillum sp. RV1423 TaxID=1443993 RepID=UPI0004B98A8B|nr:YbfB/YjiJ family MFS transporter [Herbaspirillum sp. RV1423]
MNTQKTNRKAAWRIALAGLIALSAAMGIGRFAFTPLLPMMLHDQVIDLNGGGWLATSNYLGYFIGAMLCAFWRGLPPTRTIRVGLIATALLTLGMGLLHTQGIWLLLRLLSGIASALVFVYSSGWCLQRLTQLQLPALGGIIYCGPGIGIVLTGLSSSGMVAAGWHAASGWMAFGLLTALLTLAVWKTFSGDADLRTGTPAAANTDETEPAAIKREVRWQVLAYGLAGFGYIITATFLPVIARQALPGSFWPDFFWPLFGLCVALGALFATRIPIHVDQRLLLATSYVMQAIGVIISAVLPNETGFALGSILLGLPFTAITLFAMREARRLRSRHAAGLMGLMTASYGIGQIAGPPLATRLVHASGSFTPSLSIAAAALLTGAVLYCWLALRARTKNLATA